MPIQAIFSFRNADSSLDFNNTIKDLFGKGLFTSCIMTPGPGLSVVVPPFKAISYDGVVCIMAAGTEQVNVVAGQTNYIVLRAKYDPSSNPTVQLENLSSAAYNADPDKAYLVVFATVTLPVGAISVPAGSISTLYRDTVDPLGRSYFRGFVTAFPSPTGNDRRGDFYIYSPGSGVSPQIPCFDGVNFVDISGTTLTNTLIRHRTNQYHHPNVEQHATDSQKDALVGTHGSPSATNKYVTNSDVRLPTANQTAAMAGSNGTPSATNKYVTEEKFFAVPTEIAFSSPAAASQALAFGTYGPFYVGKESKTQSANKWFRLFMADSSNQEINDEEYTNASNTPIKVIGVWKNAGLTNPLIPINDADTNGFYNSNIWIQFSNTVNTSYKLVYGKKLNFTQLTNKAEWLLRRPMSAMINNRLVKLWEDLKESGLSVDIPSEQTLPALKAANGYLREYISANFNGDMVVDGVDYERISSISTFAHNFVRNVGLTSTSANNPREINISNIRAVRGSETITVDAVVQLATEYDIDTDWPAYKIVQPKSDRRVRLYGGWNNVVDNFSYHVSAAANGSVKVTFYGTGLDVLTNLRSDLPQIDVTVDGVAGPTFDPSDVGKASNVLSGQNYNALVPIGITGGLPAGIHTVELQVGNATGSFEVQGLKVKNTVATAGAVTELPGRIFIGGQLHKVDTALTYTPPTIGVYSRGGKLIRYFDRVTGSHAKNTVQNYEGYNGTNATTVITNKLISTIVGLTGGDGKTGDIVTVNMPAGKQLNIVHYKPAANQLMMVTGSHYSSPANATVTLYGRVGAAVDHSEEQIVKRLDPLKFTAGRTDDFGNLSTGNVTGDAAFTLEDNLTTLVAEDFVKGTLDGRYSVGTLTPVAFATVAGGPVGIETGDYFEIDDGIATRKFEFMLTGDSAPGSYGVLVEYGYSAADLQVAMVKAINDAAVALYAYPAGGVNVSLANTAIGDNNVPIVESISNAATLNPIGMADGADPAPINVEECIIGSGPDSKLRITFLGTGLDLVTANTDSGLTGEIYIDGVYVDPNITGLNIPIPNTGLTRVPVVSSLPYGCHVIEVKTVGIAVAYILVYEPKTGTIDGTEYYELLKTAAFRADSVGTIDTVTAISEGAIVHTGTRELRYFNGDNLGGANDWARSSLDSSLAPKTGFYFYTKKLNSYFELEFWGSGFQLEYPTLPNGGLSNVYIDDLLVTVANFPAPASISTGITAVGQINQLSAIATGGIKTAYVTGLTLGYHTLKVLLTQNTKDLTIELVDVFTDYASNTKEISPVTLDRLEPNNTIKDTRTVDYLVEEDDTDEVTVDDESVYARIDQNEEITGAYTWTRTAGYKAIGVKRDSDSNDRLLINSDGDMYWSDGLHAPQLSMIRVASVESFGEALRFNGTLASATTPYITATGYIFAYGTTPSYRWFESDTSTARKAWEVQVASGIFKVTSYDETFSTGNDILSLDRQSSSYSNATSMTLKGAVNAVNASPTFDIWKPYDVANDFMGSISWSLGTTRTSQAGIFVKNITAVASHADFYFYNRSSGVFTNTAILTYQGYLWVQSRIGIGSLATSPTSQLFIKDTGAISAYIMSTTSSSIVTLDGAAGSYTELTFNIASTWKTRLTSSTTSLLVNVALGNSIQFGINSVVKATLDSSGYFWTTDRIGIGTAPSTDLYIAKAASVWAYLYSSGDAAKLTLRSAAGFNNSIYYLIGAGTYAITNVGATNFQFSLASGVTYYVSYPIGTVFSLSGTLGYGWFKDRLGIGNLAATPSVALHLYDAGLVTTRIESSTASTSLLMISAAGVGNNSVITFYRALTNVGQIGTSNSDALTISTNGVANEIHISNNSVLNAIIAPAYNWFKQKLGLKDASVPANDLDVVDTSGTGIFGRFRSTMGEATLYLDCKDATSTSNIYFQYGATTKARIHSSSSTLLIKCDSGISFQDLAGTVTNATVYSTGELKVRTALVIKDGTVPVGSSYIFNAQDDSFANVYAQIKATAGYVYFSLDHANGLGGMFRFLKAGNESLRIDDISDYFNIKFNAGTTLALRLTGGGHLWALNSFALGSASSTSPTFDIEVLKAAAVSQSLRSTGGNVTLALNGFASSYLYFYQNNVYKAGLYYTGTALTLGSLGSIEVLADNRLMLSGGAGQVELKTAGTNIYIYTDSSVGKTHFMHNAISYMYIQAPAAGGSSIYMNPTYIPTAGLGFVPPAGIASGELFKATAMAGISYYIMMKA